MKSYLFIFFILFIGLSGCEEKDFYSDKETDQQEMSMLRIQIDKLSEQETCINNADWKFTAIGSKVCGGATGYIAYSNKIDEELFLKKVALYNQKRKAFIVKWNLITDCSLPAMPKSIECVDGKPKFVY